MSHTASELISLEAGISYMPTFVSTDKRVGNTERTSIGYLQIGELQQYGFAKGPIFRVEFANIPSGAGSDHIKIWGLDNKDDDAPIYPISYLTTFRPILDVYLKKFIFCDSAGVEAAASGAYSIIGYKKKAIPTPW